MVAELKKTSNTQIKNKNNNKETLHTREETDHPELRSEFRQKTKVSKKSFKHRKAVIQKLNSQKATNRILFFAVLLGLIFFFTGILGILSLFGNTETTTWRLYQVTWFFGWNRMAVTGIALIVISLVIFWSVPYYFLERNQYADSYLTIGTGLALIFGFIYVLIIFADILTALVEVLQLGASFSLTTYCYLPIPLAMLAFPLFRVVTIRHRIVLPDEVEASYKEKEKEAEPLYRWRKWTAKWDHHHHWGRHHKKRGKRKHRKRRREK